MKKLLQKYKETGFYKAFDKPWVQRLLNRWELDLCVILFLIMTVLQTVQVITRYVFRYSFVWTEELAMIMFIWMGWLSISAAVTHRKHMAITVLVDALPKKVQRVMKIVSDFVFIAFCTAFLGPSIQVVQKFRSSPASTALLKIPKWIPYLIIPVMLITCIIRLLQDSVRLATEDEKVMGKSKSSMDFEAYERDDEESLKAKGKNSEEEGSK